MARMTYLPDKSVLGRFHIPEIGERLRNLANQNRLRRCGIMELEVLYSARNQDSHDTLSAELRNYERVPINDTTFDQAIEIQRTLAATGKHRRPIPDLLVAATAILNGLTVLHYDKDFDIIAEVCELRHEWIVPQGSI